MKTKSTSQTARKPSWKNVILLAITALALCASPGVVVAADCIPTTTWTDSNGSWFVAGNWNSGVPNAGTSAYINNAGTANISSTGAAACNLTLGYNAVESGKVSVAGGSLAVTNEVEIGAFGKGTLIVTNGGSVTAGLLTIAALVQGSVSSFGTVTVDGGAFTINTRADVGGDNGTLGGIGLLTVKNSGTVSASNLRVYTSGTLTGNGTISTNSGTTIDGTLKPNGTLTIGGNLTFNGSVSLMQCTVNQSSWDRVEVSGRAALGGRLSVTMTGTFTGDFPLLHASTLVGTFSSVSITYTGCLAPSIVYDYDNGYVYLHVESTCQ